MAAEEMEKGGEKEELRAPAAELKDQTHNCTSLDFCACACVCESVHQCLTDRRGNYSSTVAVTSRAESSHPGTDGPRRGSYWPALPPLKIYLLNDPWGGGRVMEGGRNKEVGEEQKTTKKEGRRTSHLGPTPNNRGGKTR